jgi:dynein heavy chain
MCWFHAVVVERKKFGPQGWNRVYPFNVGDLTTCVDVLGNYIEDRPKVPWEDLRYVFGEIMYGGHITDDRDRVLCMAYLEQLVVPECVDGMDLAPGFGMPPTNGPYSDYLKYVDEACPHESPILYGLHPNAEINFRSAQADVLFRTITELQPKQAADAGAETPQDIVRNKIADILEKMPEIFNLADISERLDEDRTPVQHVFFQECERISALLECMKRTLTELQLGLRGALSMTQPMQNLFDQLFLEKVPEVWTVFSFASLRPLASWFENLGARNQQLVDWTGELVAPKVTIISHFFNPMSLITAIMQHTAMTSNLDLDQMGLVAEVTKRVPEQIDAPARDAAHIYGLHMEGARWDSGQQSMDDARMKELYPKMPVITVRSQQLNKIDRRDQYECPVYKTQARGPTFVVGMFLKTKQPARKWTIAGVGLLLDVVE